MFEKKLNLKILTSIFIVFFFVVFFCPYSRATYIEDLPSFSIFKTNLESNSTFIAEKDNYSNILIGYVGYSNNSGSHMFWVLMTNNNPINFTYSSDSQKYCAFVIDNYEPHQEYATSSYINLNKSKGTMSFYLRDGYSGYSNMLDRFNDNVYYYKLTSPITFNGNEVITPPSSYDFSFIINNHNFDFTFNGVPFSNGVTIDSDTIKQGHYVCSLYQYEEMTYYNSTYKNYWVSGFIDYYPYNEKDPSKYFYQSTGYNTLKIYDSSGDNDYFYRFYFKGYSSDSSYKNFDNNIITNNVNDFNTFDNYKPFRSSTFFYSNRNIYWGIDSSLYGYNGITTKPFYQEDSTGVNVLNVSTTERKSTDPEEDSTTYAIGNNVYNVPSSNANINNNSLHNYNGSSYGSISNYNSEENIFGTQTIAEDTSNWSTLDYVKHIPRAIGNIPLSIMNMLLKLIIPNHDDLVDIYLGFQEFSQAHLGVLNAPISWIFNFLGSIRDKYSENYSYYYFTIPGFRWFNTATGQKETLVESQTINLNTYFIGDEDWLHLWSVLRYIVSILIYINLIVMLFNKYKSIIGGDRVIINNSSGVGDISRKEFRS